VGLSLGVSNGAAVTNGHDGGEDDGVLAKVEALSAEVQELKAMLSRLVPRL
jgi:hypothetical protein